jgi:hypothetical protein
VRATFLIACVLCAISSAAVSAVDVLRTAVVGDISVKVVRAPSGWLIDVGTAAPDRSGDHVRYSAGDVDISERVLSSPPVIDLIYAFSGVPDKDQCVYKTMLDALAVVGGAPFAAFAPKENELCAELGIAPEAALAEYIDPETYTRLLVIQVAGDNGATGGLRLPSGRVTATLNLRPEVFADRQRLFDLLKSFIGANTNGIFHFLEDVAVAPGTTVQARVFRGANLVGSVDVNRASLAEQLWPHRNWIWAGAAVVLLLVAIALFGRLRAGRPLRVIVVGYGSKVDYSLGPIGDRPVARITRYSNGTIRIERLAKEESITVKGKNLKNRRRIDVRDEVIVDGKTLKLV